MERLVKNYLLTIIPLSFPRHLFHPKIFTRFLYPLVHFLPHLYGERARLPSNSKMDTRKEQEKFMDLVYIGLIVSFSAITAALVYGCDRIRRAPS
jgi:hypothetical protein